MRSLLVSQTAAVAGCHPTDVRGRRSMQTVVDEVQAALQQYEAAQE
jgi:hypothetical protein